MSIDSLRDGFVTLCLNDSLNVYDGACQMLVEGQYLGNVVPADTPIAVNSINDCETLFGAGSILCESLKKVFKQCSQNIQVWALPREDNPLTGEGAAVAATYTFTIAGTATSPGVFSLFMLDGDYIIEFPVTTGMTPTQMATALIALIPVGFPYSATNTAGVITFTALNKGTCGNFLAPVYNYLGLQNYAPAGVTVTVAAGVVGSLDPVPLNYAAVLGSCCYSVYACLIENTAVQTALDAFLKSLWACNIPEGFNGAVPQCFGHGYVWNSGTLGDVLASTTNSATLNRWAQPLNDPNAPYLLVAAYAALTACSACTNPELSIQGPVDGVLSAVDRPTSCSEPWSYPARLTLQNAGFVTWGPVTNAASQLTNPFVYQDITNNLTDHLARPNATWKSTSTRRWAANFSGLLSQWLDGTFNGLAAFSDRTKIKPGVFGTTRNMMRAKLIAWLNDQSGRTISQLQDVDTQVVLTSDLDTAPPCRGIPGNYALTLVVQPPVRINNIATTIFPQLFTNCNNTRFTRANQLANQ